MDAELDLDRIMDLQTVQRKAREQQFDRIIRDHGQSVSRLASVYEPDPTRRDDLVQEIALALWQALPRFRGECSERTLIYRIAHNRALTHRYRGRRATEDLAQAGEVADTRSTPEVAVSQEQLRDRLLKAVRLLAEPYRDVIVLLLEGLSHVDIASILGISEGNVAVRANRARKELRRLLGERA